jgi:broad specificity phosphatase PhoE
MKLCQEDKESYKFFAFLAETRERKMKVYVIRHGESQYNKDGLYTGWTNVPLTEKGKEDAKRVGALLSGVKFDKIYTSDLMRAMNTAEIAIPGCVYETNEKFREINVGNMAGRLISESTAEKKSLYANVGYSSECGESRAEFAESVKKARKELESLDYERIAIFCHGGWLRTFLDAVMECFTSRSKIICNNCAMAVFEYNGSIWRLNSWINLD